LTLFVPKLTLDALVLADNVLSHPDEIAEYLRVLESLAQFDRVIVPTGKGLSVAYRSIGG
jgi:predicted O-methyltransferase YrrM